MAAAGEFALLAIYVYGDGDGSAWGAPSPLAAWERIKETLLPSVLKGDERSRAGLKFECVLHVFPTAEARASAIRLARGALIRLQPESSRALRDVDLCPLTAAQLATYREFRAA